MAFNKVVVDMSVEEWEVDEVDDLAEELMRMVALGEGPRKRQRREEGEDNGGKEKGGEEKGGEEEGRGGEDKGGEEKGGEAEGRGGATQRLEEIKEDQDTLQRMLRNMWWEEEGSCAACKQRGVYIPNVDVWWLIGGWCHKCWVGHYSKKLVEIKTGGKKNEKWWVAKKGGLKKKKNK